MKVTTPLLATAAAAGLAAGWLLSAASLTAAADPHAYFDALVSRPDFWKGYSLRPRAGQPATSVHYENQLKIRAEGGYLTTNASGTYVTYNPSADPDPNRQDAAKVVIPAFVAYATIRQPMLAATSGTEETIELSTVANFDNNRALKLDDEIVVIKRLPNSPSSAFVTVIRGQFSTSAAAHAAGTMAHASENSLLSQVRLPLDTSDGRTYLFTWDGYWTPSYVLAGSEFGHKEFQVTSLRGGDQWLEIMTQFSGPLSRTPNPAWNSASDVAAVTARGYSIFTPPVTHRNPITPMANPPFIIKPKKWTRFWIVVEANREDDLSKFSDVTTLAQPVATASETTVTINHPDTLLFNPFTSATAIAGSSWPGRSMRIDNEVMTIVSGPSTGLTRTLTVVRGAYGSTPAPHAASATVQLVHDYASLYVADEDTEATALYYRLPGHLPINSATPSLRGSMNNFWIEFNASETSYVRGSLRDFVAYVRNFAALVNPPPDVAPLLLRPAAGVPPPYTGPIGPAPPSNLRIVR